MIKSIITIGCMVNAMILLSQPVNWEWARYNRGNNPEIAVNFAAANDGSVLAAGYFNSDSIIFGNIKLLNIPGNVLPQVFIVKYDRLGNVLWAKNPVGVDDDWANGITTDADGNIYVTGFFRGATIIFDTITLTAPVSNSTDNIFVAKYNRLGQVVWAKAIGGDGSAVANAIVTDGSKNIYISGYFTSQSIAFGATTLHNTGSNAMYVAKLDMGGNCLWAKAANGNAFNTNTGIAADGDADIFIAGKFGGDSLNFDSIHLSNSNTNLEQKYLAKYDSAGNIKWALANGQGSTADALNDLTTDESGNIYITGSFAGDSIAFGNYILHNNGGTCYIAKYNTAGNITWAKAITGSGATVGASLATDNNNRLYVSGSFTSNIILGVTTLVNQYLVRYATFVAVMDSNANVLSANKLNGGGSATQRIRLSNHTSTGLLGGIWPQYNWRIGTDTLIADNLTMFVAKLNWGNDTLVPCTQVYTDTITDTVCGSFIFKGQALSTSGNYIDSLQTVNGCDSIVYLNLTILPSYIDSGSISVCKDSVYLFNGIMHTGAGIYRDTLQTMRGCDSIIILSVTIKPAVSFNLSVNSICANNSPLSLSGGSPTGGLYSGAGVANGYFNPANAPLGADTITYAFTDTSGCQSSADAVIVVDSLPVVMLDTIWVSPGTTSITVSPSNAISYTWQLENYLSDTAFNIPGIDTGIASYNCGDAGAGLSWGTQNYYIGYGQLRVVLNLPGGCSDTTAWVAFNNCVGAVISVSDISGLHVYPKPATDELNLNYQVNVPTQLQISVVDLEGRQIETVYNGKINSGSYTKQLPISDLAAGVYVLRFTTSSESSNLKFFKVIR